MGVLDGDPQCATASSMVLWIGIQDVFLPCQLFATTSLGTAHSVRGYGGLFVSSSRRDIPQTGGRVGFLLKLRENHVIGRRLLLGTRIAQSVIWPPNRPMKLTAGGGRPQLIAGVGHTCPRLTEDEGLIYHRSPARLAGLF